MPSPPPPIHVQILRLPGFSGPLPAYQSDHAAGMDVHAHLPEPLVIAPRTCVLIPTGFALAVPEGYEAQLRPRSGLAVKHGITLPNAPGTIDADYRGEVKVGLINLSTATFTVEPGMRIAQMILKPVPRVVWEEVAKLPETARGDGGFGHTGH